MKRYRQKLLKHVLLVSQELDGTWSFEIMGAKRVHRQQGCHNAAPAKAGHRYLKPRHVGARLNIFGGGKQSVLFRPDEAELRRALLRKYAGKRVRFDQVRQETWDLPFIERHYRSVLGQLRAEGIVQVTPVSSRTNRGLRGMDCLVFRASNEEGSG